MELSRQEYRSGLPFPPPGDLPQPVLEPVSPTSQSDSLPTEPPGKPLVLGTGGRTQVFLSHQQPLALMVCTGGDRCSLGVGSSPHGSPSPFGEVYVKATLKGIIKDAVEN